MLISHGFAKCLQNSDAKNVSNFHDYLTQILYSTKHIALKKTYSFKVIKYLIV